MRKVKHYGVCHICGKYGELTFEHIPPKNGINFGRARMYNGKEMLKKYRGKKSHYIILQQGMGKYSLCEQCNNNMGAWYANEYCTIANNVAIKLHEFEPLKHGSEIVLGMNNIAVLPFIKQVISMFCSLIPFEMVDHLGFNDFLLEKEKNKVNSTLFDLRMYLTPIKTGQILSGLVGALIKNEQNGLDCAKVVDLAAYPFGFILNLSPDTEIKYGTSINSFLKYSYDERGDIELLLEYLERYNEDAPLPLVFKPLPNRELD